MIIPPLKLALASKSPSRLTTLRAAGMDPITQVSNVDEDALLAQICGGASSRVLALATAKARDVAAHPKAAAHADLILGCDSMFEFGGEIVGKPHSPNVARERLHAMSGNTGILHTGHFLVHRGSLRGIGAVSHAAVHVAELTDQEIDAYVESGEPLEVAGSFTIDGRAAPFITSIEGDHHGVVGVSPTLMRSMLREYGISITQLWTDARAIEADLNEEGVRFFDAERPARIFHGADGFILCSCGRRHWGLNGAAGICAYRHHNGRIEILLQLRTSWSHGGRTWGIPGGAIDWEETPEEGGLREFEEETGIGGASLSPKSTHYNEHGDWAYTTTIAECVDGVEAVPDRESERLEWVDISQPLPETLLPSFAAVWPEVREMVWQAASAG